jgi:isopenicillin-N N-acyltransferase-like protein
MKNTGDMPVLTLEGSAKERGQIHGEALKPKILEHIEMTKGFMGENMESTPQDAMDDFLSNTNFLPAIEKWTPFLLGEMEGIAAGAGVDFKEILLLNLADEAWWYFMEKKGQFSSPTVGAENCSSLGIEVQEGFPPMIAQNLDMPAYYDGLQALLHIKEDDEDLEIYAISFAGVVGAVGLNNRGVGMCENTLIHLKHAADGLPVMHVSRGILAQPTLEDAVSFVHNVNHASGQNYVIGSPDGVVDYECSAHKVRRFVPSAGSRMVYHTNHALVNDDAFDLGKQPENSLARFHSVETDLKTAQQPVTVDLIKKTLSSHASAPYEVCVHPSDQKHGITASCMIMELGQTPRLHYTAGPPCETDFKTLSF